MTVRLTYLIVVTIFKVIRGEDKSSYFTIFRPFTNLIILIGSELLICRFDNYKQYLLLFVVMNGLYFGLTVAKLIVTTMSKTSLEIPSFESVFYLGTILLALAVPSIEKIVIVVQVIFIALYYVRYFGSVISQLLRELKIERF
jgi:hypothetical protein